MHSAPGFWDERPGFLANLLLPMGAAWDAAGWLRHALTRPYRPPVPVVCVGNLVAGGAGKTPVALALAWEFTARGVAVHMVTRGYGGRLDGPVRVDPACHDADAVGDEALLLAARAPSWVARDRAAGVCAAAAVGAELVILDDGFQNPSIAKDFSLVVVDAMYGFGNGRVIPAGPLREGLGRGLARADAIVLLDTEAGRICLERDLGRMLPILPAVLAPVAGERLAGSRLLAFAGIGRPEKFFVTLRSLGAVLVGTRAFPDHHRFSVQDIEELFREAERADARLVTTAKDIVRVPLSMRAGIEVLKVEIRWPDPGALAGLIGPVVLSARTHGRRPVEPNR
jgi:tetraacyldisaccharide 4'-kinase